MSRLEQAGVQISMDGKGRALDNVFVERLWRTVKYEHLYVMGYETVPDLERGLKEFFRYYNRGADAPVLGLRDAGVGVSCQALPRLVSVGRERPLLGRRPFAADRDEAANSGKQHGGMLRGLGGRDYSDLPASRGTENGDHFTGPSEPCGTAPYGNPV